MNSSSRPRRSVFLRVVAAALVACAAAFLSGCGALIGDHLPAATGGLPEATPERAATPVAYPAVHNMPPSRSSTPLNNAQQKQLEDDLVAARNRYGTSPDAPPATGSTANPNPGGARNP
jgi:hypothetical protein